MCGVGGAGVAWVTWASLMPESLFGKPHVSNDDLYFPSTPENGVAGNRSTLALLLLLFICFYLSVLYVYTYIYTQNNNKYINLHILYKIHGTEGGMEQRIYK